jgi:hypothetical protein
MIADQPKTDAEYQAQWDAETLASAEEIKADEGRLKAAEARAAKMAEDKDEQAKAMRKVAGKGSGGPAGPGARTGDLSGTSNPFNVGARLK